jgi:hypothetical protein
MTRGRSRKKKRGSSKSTNENDHSQTRQDDKIATPPAQSTSPRRGRPEELTEMNHGNPLQTQPEIGNDYYNAASAVSPKAHHQDKKFSPLTALPNHYLMLHRHWRIKILRNRRTNNHFLIVLHRFGTNIYFFMLGNWKSIVMKLIYLLLWQQFSILSLFMIQMNFPLTLTKMMIVFPSFRTLQRPPSSQKIFLERFLTVQLSTGRLKCATTLNFVFVHVQFIPDRGAKK